MASQVGSWGRAHGVIAKNKGEFDKQIHYASIIQKLQKELVLGVSSFPQLGIMALDDYEDEEKYNDDKYKYTTKDCWWILTIL